MNEIKLDKISKSTSKKTILLYPQDIKIDASSKYKAIVKKAYFMEGIYLIEVIFDDQILFLQHDKYIDSNKTVGIHFSTEIIKLRSN